MHMYSVIIYGKAEFSAAITPVFSVFRNYSNMLIWCSRNIFENSCAA